MKHEQIRFSDGEIGVIGNDGQVYSVSELAQQSAIEVYEDYREICKDDSINLEKKLNLGIKVTNALANVGMPTNKSYRLF